MTFEERLKNLKNVSSESLETLLNWEDRFKNLSLKSFSSSDYISTERPTWTYLLNEMLSGNIQKTKKQVEMLTPVLEIMKKSLKMYNSYKGEKGLSTNSVGYLWFSHSGKLFMSEHINEKNLLYFSRLLRDAEKRCMQHPRNKIK